MDVSVGAIAARINAEVLGNADRVLTDAQPLSKAGPASLSFFADESKLRLLDDAQAGAVLISRSRIAELTDQHRTAQTFIVVDRALDAFISFLQTERPERPRSEIGCSPQACIAESATIGASTNVFPGAYVGEDVVIGEHCDIHPGVVIGAGCRIGDHVTMYPNVVLYHDLSIGSHVIIHANAVIGADGFGYQLRNGRLEKIPHLGSVRIEDHVEIGACATIDRGMIGPTVIGTGTKVDNLVMIAHNCEIGRHNAFASQTGFAGSCTTGDYVRAGGQAGIGDHLTIGTGASLAASIALHSNVPDGETWGGYPARPLDESIKIMMTQARLPEMRNRLRDLEKQVKALTQQLESSSAKDAA